MSKKRIGQALLSVAVTLLIALGVIEFTNRKDKGATDRCQMTDVSVEAWPRGDSIRWLGKNLVVSFHEKNRTLRKYNWSVKDGRLILNHESEIKLVCDQPGYNCFQSQVNKESLVLDVVYFKPPYGIAKARYGGRESLFPIFWDAKESLKLGAPVQMCGKLFDTRQYEMAILGDRLYVFQNTLRLLGGFSLSTMNGAGPTAAAREPEEVYSVTSSGRLGDATCADGQSSTQSLFWIPHNDSFVFYTPAESLSLYFYNRSLNRVQLVEEKPNWVIRGNNGYLFIEKDSLTVIADGKKSVKSVPGLSEFSPKNVYDLSAFFWEELNFIGSIQDRSWLSNRHLNMLELSSTSPARESLNLGFSLTSRKDDFSANISDDNKFLYHWEQTQSGDLSMRSISCH
ncbi:MAG: hypothetical protein JNL11_07670 [Bdellovibrionaceae bacterium]|nr:hypothetical protein [Pseudobdellovibrionaceae bacterium]